MTRPSKTVPSRCHEMELEIVRLLGLLACARVWIGDFESEERAKGHSLAARYLRDMLDRIDAELVKMDAK